MLSHSVSFDASPQTIEMSALLAVSSDAQAIQDALTAEYNATGAPAAAYVYHPTDGLRTVLEDIGGLLEGEINPTPETDAHRALNRVIEAGGIMVQSTLGKESSDIFRAAASFAPSTREATGRGRTHFARLGSLVSGSSTEELLLPGDARHAQAPRYEGTTLFKVLKVVSLPSVIPPRSADKEVKDAFQAKVAAEINEPAGIYAVRASLVNSEPKKTGFSNRHLWQAVTVSARGDSQWEIARPTMK